MHASLSPFRMLSQPETLTPYQLQQREGRQTELATAQRRLSDAEQATAQLQSQLAERDGTAAHLRGRLNRAAGELHERDEKHECEQSLRLKGLSSGMARFAAGISLPAQGAAFTKDPPDGPAAVPQRSENAARIAELEEYTAGLERQTSETQGQTNQLNERIRNHAKAKALFMRGLSSSLSRFAAGLRLPR